MENMKTLALTGSEEKAEFSGGNAWLRNDGTDTIYAAKSAGISAGADGVVAIPAGQSAPVYGANGTVFLLGTGSVQLIGSDYGTNPFKTSAQSGGSGADSVARAAISAHAGNADIHVTAAEKAAWNAVNYSNPNLLINPDFRINQRGESVYTAAGYTVDRWQVARDASSTTGDFTITCSENGLTINNQTNGPIALAQKVEKFSALFGKEVTLSASVNGNIVSMSGTIQNASGTVFQVTGDFGFISVYVKANTRLSVNVYINSGVTAVLDWIKLEIGGKATMFVAPDPATELAKCQRYYQIRTTNGIDPLDMRPSMRTITDIRQVTGGYAYVAEL